MAKKKKQTVWHKKKGKFIPPSSIKPHTVTKDDTPGVSKTNAKQDRIKAFAKDFGEKIKKAAKESS